tara:strand:- start:29503 stop:30234 length:732 start_codon:yes stop_codon:yes gene_type:complete
MLKAEQIENNWNSLIKLIEDSFDGERKDNLLKMYNHLKDRMMFAPASSKEHFHNAFPGGYVDHVLNITRAVKSVYQTWKEHGAHINFTEEEMIFATLHHDLGKVGDDEMDYYIPNESEWHRKNQGKIYTPNPKLQYMNVSDRSLWLLQKFNVKLNQTEYIGLKLADGLYEEGNKQYFISFSPDFELQTNLPHIIHQADMLASKTERDNWKYGKKEQVNTKVPKTQDEQKQVENLKSKFDELFA